MIGYITGTGYSLSKAIDNLNINIEEYIKEKSYPRDRNKFKQNIVNVNTLIDKNGDYQVILYIKEYAV